MAYFTASLITIKSLRSSDKVWKEKPLGQPNKMNSDQECGSCCQVVQTRISPRFLNEILKKDFKLTIFYCTWNKWFFTLGHLNNCREISRSLNFMALELKRDRIISAIHASRLLKSHMAVQLRWQFYMHWHLWSNWRETLKCISAEELAAVDGGHRLLTRTTFLSYDNLFRRDRQNSNLTFYQRYILHFRIGFIYLPIIMIKFKKAILKRNSRRN